ncbi:MAG: hypothetical protein ACLSH3_08095 [Alistipes finegoldii]
MGTPSAYVQFAVDAKGQITYEPFCTGMMVNAKYTAYAYYPGEYIWGKDFSDYNKENKKLSDKVLQLYPVYCLPRISVWISQRRSLSADRYVAIKER